MSATRILSDGELFDIQNPGADFDAESPACVEVGGLCVDCERHLAALADIYAA